jgi:hypothetical protein
MTERLTSRIVEIYTDSGWYDITSDVLSSITFSHGILNIAPSDVIASTGIMRFTLNNLNNKYSSSGSRALSTYKFDRGVPCRLTVSYDDNTVVKWYGRIANYKPDTPVGLPSTINVTVVDYVDTLVNHSLLIQEVLYNQTIDQAAGVLIDTTIPNPLQESLGDGVNTFPTVFDAAGARASAYSELNKLVLSELSYAYVRHCNPDGETLVVEGGEDRINRDYTEITLNKSESGFLRGAWNRDNSGFLLQENGFKIILNQTTTSAINEILDGEVVHGENMINQISLKAYPRYLDTSPQVLFSLNKPFFLAASGTKQDLKITYVDPRGGSVRVNGKDMILPVATTDYLMNAQEDGGGADLTANLTISTVDGNGNPAPFGAAGAILKFSNTVATGGWITFLRVRGTGIYFDNPVEVFVNDADSIASYGTFDEKIDQKYVVDAGAGEELSKLIVGREKNPRLVLRSVKMQANLNSAMMRAFLYNDVGDLVHITYSGQGFSSSYFIQGVDAEIGLDGLITFSWILLESVLWTFDFFTLDSATLGLLDSGNVLAY